MINQNDNFMDLIIRASKIFPILSFIIGLSITWKYLNDSGLSNEVLLLLSSPHILFAIAVYSLLISALIILIVITMPLVISFCDKRAEVEWRKKLKINKFWFHFTLIFIPSVVFILLVAFGNETAFVWIFSLCILLMIFILGLY